MFLSVLYFTNSVNWYFYFLLPGKYGFLGSSGGTYGGLGGSGNNQGSVLTSLTSPYTDSRVTYGDFFTASSLGTPGMEKIKFMNYMMNICKTEFSRIMKLIETIYSIL